MRDPQRTGRDRPLLETASTQQLHWKETLFTVKATEKEKHGPWRWLNQFANLPVVSADWVLVGAEEHAGEHDTGERQLGFFCED